MFLFMLLFPLTSYQNFSAKTYKLKPYIYHIDFDGMDEMVNNLHADLNRRIAEIEDKLNVALPDQIHIYLTLTREEFYQKTRGKVPSWSGGVALPSQKLIIVKAPIFFGQGVPLAVITTHELVHILLYGAVKGKYLPRWLNEGLAQVLAGESRRGSLTAISRAAFADRLMGLPRVDKVLNFSSPKARLAYMEAQSAADWFIERFGWTALHDLFNFVRSDKDFEQAFFLATGIGYESFQIEWMEYARNHYKLWILLEINNLLWYLIVLFAIFAIFVAYFRRRRQLKRMVDDDDYFDEVDDTPIEP